MLKHINKAILSFIDTFIKAHGYSPSIRDIKLGLNISSTSVVGSHLKALKLLGFISYTPNTARSIVVIKSTK